jgi:hypothetical protein
VVGGATSAGLIYGVMIGGVGMLGFIIGFDGVISAGLIMGFGIGVSGSLGIILSLALKYDGRSPLPVGGSIMLDILVLLLSILDSFNILDVMKDDNKLLSCWGVGCDIIT